MYLTEFNEESAIRGWRQDGIEEGRAEGAKQKANEDARNMLKMNVGTTKQVSQITGLPLDKVLELQKELAAERAAPAN